MKLGGEKNQQAYIIGSGIAGLATAVFLIKDGGMKGEYINIIDNRPQAGGSFDGQGSAKTGYLCRGYRIFERSVHVCTYDLLSKIPSPRNHRKNLKQEFFDFNRKVKVHAKARLIEKGKIVDAYQMGLSWRDRLAIFKLLVVPEWFLGTNPISYYFTPEFFKSNFWIEWATTCSFEPRHSAFEMKRYLERLFHNAPVLDTLECVLKTPFCEHDFFVLPIVKWLQSKGVKFRQNSQVTDIQFNSIRGKKSVEAIISKRGKIKLTPADLVFYTNGSITTDSSVGSMTRAPKPVKTKSATWDLWKQLAQQLPNMGKPEVFCDSIKKSEWTGFTITFNDATFFKLLEKLTGNKPGTGGAITFKNSGWLMSIDLPHQPYFIDQPKNTFVCWGYGLLPHNQGDYIKKKMIDCTGREILEELIYQLGLQNKKQAIMKRAICLPVLMPYITSQFLPRQKSDRPEVIPKGTRNFACIGQYVEIPHEVVFMVECSVRSAKLAVKKLLKLSNEIPPPYQKKYNLKYVYKALKMFLR